MAYVRPANEAGRERAWPTRRTGSTNRATKRRHVRLGIRIHAVSAAHMPFAERWLAREGHERTHRSIQFLRNGVAIKSYPQLVESTKGMVAQHEHTVLITEDGCEVLTKVT